MSERIAKTDPTPPPSPEELLARDVDEIAIALLACRYQANCHDPEPDRIRIWDYVYGCGKLEKTIESAGRQGFVVGLTADQEEIATVSFVQGAYDILTQQRGKPIPPGSFFPLQTTQKIAAGLWRDGYKLYAGSFRARLEVVTIAKLLGEDKARLSLRKDEAEPAAPLDE